MNKHTPGPWASDNVGAVIGADGFSVGIAFQRASTRVEYEEGGWLERDAVANARLMAAAPDLLEALESLLSYHDKCGVDSSHGDKARSAIAKAKGEQ